MSNFERLNSISDLVNDWPGSAQLIAIGLNDLYAPEIIEEGTNLGEWITFTSTTVEPKLTLRFNEDGEFAAASDVQFGPYTGEVSIPALLRHLHSAGRRVVEGGGRIDSAKCGQLTDIILGSFSIDEFEAVEVDFTEMVYNAVTTMGGPGNVLIVRMLAAAERSLIEIGQDIIPYFGTLKAADFKFDNHNISLMEQLLSHCRKLVPRDPDNALSHYFRDIGEVIRTGQPPVAVTAAIAMRR